MAIKRGSYRNVSDYIHNGEVIVGLKRRPNGGRFYSARTPGKMFGSDPAMAVHRFRRWEADSGIKPQRVAIEIVPPHRYATSEPTIKQLNEEGAEWVDKVVEAVPSILEPGYEPGAPITTDLATLKRQWILETRDLILNDPRKAAIALDVPHLAYYPAEPTEPQMTLEALGDAYTSGKRNKRTMKSICAKERSQSKRWWQEFIESTRVRHARQITEDHVQAYHAWVMSEYDNGRSPTWVKHRFGKIKTILKYGTVKNIDRADCERVLSYCAILEPPAPREPNPQPISRDDFAALLAVADVRQRAMLLCSLNLCLHSSELAIAKADLDLDAATFTSSRTKTGIVRCAVLWDATIQAIRTYTAANPSDSSVLFLTQRGTPVDGMHVRRMFGTLRAKAGLDALANDATGGLKRYCLEFAHIRDGSYSHATDGGVAFDHARCLAGHKVGMLDRYVKRNAKALTGDCCKAVGAFYGLA